jgi:parallel beta-helix repeat protein
VADQFTYVTTPIVSGISPSKGPAIGGTTVTITGVNLANAWAVDFGATLATIVSNTDTQIVVASPANVVGDLAGTVDVTVATVGGISATSSADLFTYVPTPTVTGINPTFGPAAGGTTVVIQGTGLANATAVMFGTKAVGTIISDSDTLLVVNSPANVAGTVDVTVVSLGGTSSALAADQFTYIAAPTITSLNPSAGPLAGGTTVTITGNYFTGAAGVYFGTTPAASFVVNSNTKITAVAPPGTGTVDVTIVNNGGTSAISATDKYTYAGVPSVTSISPTSGPVPGGTTVTIVGANLANAIVKFGTKTATIQSDTATQIVVTSPAGVAGAVDVTVVTAGGTSAIVTADQFTYIPAPTVTGISPSSGPVAGGTTVTITGTSLANASVKFGTKTATIQSNTATQIVVLSPAGVAGTVDVTVTNANGVSVTSTADQFTYVGVPTVTAISPTLGPAAGGTSVTITGANLANATVKFGSVTATIQSDSATQIVVLSPVGVAGTVDVTVTTIGGTSATSAADRFTYVPAALVVTTGVDELDPTYNAANLSLRTALSLSNALPGATTISFSPSLDGATLNLSLGELPITDSVTIQGPGAGELTINAGGKSRIFDVNDNNSSTSIAVEIDGLTLIGGGNVNYGGAIDSQESLTANNLIVKGNTALNGGGGIFVSTSGKTIIQNSTISGNSASGGDGGGLYAATVGGGTTLIASSTISGNSANMGGGIYAPTWRLGQITIQDSTISGNAATLIGGGIWNNTSYGGTTTIQNSTITGNVADSDSNGAGKGGGLYVAGGTPSIASTIIAGNIDHTQVAPDIFGAVALSNSLIGDSAGSGQTEAPVGTPDTNGNLIGGPTHGVIDPKLGSLANNGGPTQTYALLTGSPAIDMGSNPANLTYDQRGASYPRVWGARADIGAYEYTPTPAAPAVTAISPATGSTTGGTTVTITGTNLAGATAVKFGGVAATIQSNTATQIVVISPVGAAGTVDVTVTSAAGTSAASTTDKFSYVSVVLSPKVTAISPASGSTAGGTTVTIIGTNLTGATAVKFGNFSATIQSNTDTQIVVLSPANAVGTVDVTVTTANGISATSTADLFAYLGAAQATTVGLYNPTNSTFLLRDTNDTGFAQSVIAYGAANVGYVPLVGDWNGDGMDTIGLYNPTTSVFFLSDGNTGGFANDVFAFGPANSGWTPIVGDWDGNGTDTIGLYNPATSTFYLRNSNSAGFANVAFAYGPGNSGWTPVAGDWNGDGKDTIGLYNPTTSMFYLKNNNTTGFADTAFSYGPAHSGWKPLAGDWTGSGKDTVGLFNSTTSTFYLRNSNSTGYANKTFAYGPSNAGWIPLIGDWTGAGQTEMAAAQVTASANVPTLAQADIQPIVNEAITLWSQAGLDAATLQKLRQAQFVVTDLRGAEVGETDGNVIYLDANAAGNGWFVDPTPADNEEFSASAGSQQLKAVDPRALDRIDLLTVVEHELGHIAGLKDVEVVTDDLMNGVLGAGVRRTAAHTDAALASKSVS